MFIDYKCLNDKNIFTFLLNVTYQFNIYIFVYELLQIEVEFDVDTKKDNPFYTEDKHSAIILKF